MATRKSEKSKTNGKEGQFIVGIGASAGGLEALQSLLSSLPSNLGFSYVVIQHLSPDYKSLLSEILSKYTDMPVIQAEQGMRAQSDCVYVIPPRQNLSLKNGVICLSEQVMGGLHLPIDGFFKSIAEDVGAKAIAIILSGTGSDGTNGIKNVKEKDGMVIVQSPSSCKFNGMPNSAIRTGLVDFQGTPEEIVSELEHISDVSQKGEFQLKLEKEINDDLMERIYYILRKVSNINFTHYRKATILRRAERRMMLAHRDTLSDYVDYLYAVPNEAKILSKEVLIGVTNFFRDPEYFEVLQEKVITTILSRTPEEETVRVWVAGCSTGEEAYSMAILFCETMEQLGIKRSVKIFATDLDASAITNAGKGVYSSSIAASVSAARLSRFFSRKGDNYVINRDVRRMLVFAPHNVIQDPPFGKLDLISCRNLLIYFQPVLQKDLFAIFHASLKDGGFLFLGKSEAVGAYTEVFPVVDAMAKIFSHRSDIKIRGAKAIPYLQTMIEDVDGSEDSREPAGSAGASVESDEHLAINTALLERFMPACLVVNDENELVYVYGDTKDYIAFPVGRVTSALFDIIAESLRIPVSTALKESREKLKMVQYTEICFETETIKSTVNLTVTPISKSSSGPSSLYALIFTEIKDAATTIPEAVRYNVDHMAAQRITDLEQELSAVHTRLNNSVTEQECANEELQASNEELLTANEELQSSNEELQSVNEELYTVNSEYQMKLTELAEMNDDITNFLATTFIGIIFVDSKLCLRRYTNYVATEFNVLDQDIGRPIDFISYQFTGLNLSTVCTRVIESLMPDEREVSTKRGKTFFVRVAPFRTTENKILGCVLTFVDISAQRQEQEKLRNTENQLFLAKQASEAKSDFLSRMSHEIRTPMNAIVGLSEILLTQLGDKEVLRSTAQQLTETVNYMTSIVSDILEMSQLESGRLTLNAKPIVMRDLLRSVVSMVQPRMTQCELKFDVSISNKFDTLYMGDATRIQQVLMNVLTNAMMYTPAGGKVRLRAFEKAVENGVAGLCFVVSDTGIGIGDNMLQGIFKPFVRENNSDNADGKMGLGLPIAESLVKLMNGEISVESHVSKGTTFTIDLRLPIVSEQKAEDEARDDGRRPGLIGCNVLIAEDNSMNRSILESLLSSQGISFASANDGDAAVKLYETSDDNAFECILMDMRMPNLSGMDATAQIRASNKPDAKRIPIIAISANAFSDDIKTALESGANDYLTKPINTKRLFDLIEKYRKAAPKKRTAKAEAKA